MSIKKWEKREKTNHWFKENIHKLYYIKMCELWCGTFMYCDENTG